MSQLIQGGNPSAAANLHYLLLNKVDFWCAGLVKLVITPPVQYEGWYQLTHPSLLSLLLLYRSRADTPACYHSYSCPGLELILQLTIANCVLCIPCPSHYINVWLLVEWSLRWQWLGHDIYCGRMVSLIFTDLYNKHSSYKQTCVTWTLWPVCQVKGQCSRISIKTSGLGWGAIWWGNTSYTPLGYEVWGTFWV